MASVITGSIGLVVAGPLGAMVGAAAPHVWKLLRHRSEPDPPATLILLLLLVQLRSGLSVLAAIIAVSDAVPAYRSLKTVARVARVSGLTSAMPYAPSLLAMFEDLTGVLS